MSNEEIIKILERKSTIPEENENFELISQAFDEAISKLRALEKINTIITNFSDANLLSIIELQDALFAVESICSLEFD